jgi:hypothetical protein
MKNKFTIIIFIYSILLFPQNQIVDELSWIGINKMDKFFLINLIETKVNTTLDSLVLKKDIETLSRLNGISNITFEVVKKSNNYKINFKVVENFTIMPSLSLWTTDFATAFRVGVFEYNFLGKNNTVGTFYQYNGVHSYGINMQFPFLFKKNLGLEVNAHNLGSIEPLYFDNNTANYFYFNKTLEVLAMIRLNYKHSLKIGGSFFNENYEYRDGATNENVPIELNLNKILFKTNYFYDDIKYNYYLLDGFRNSTNFQFVSSVNYNSKSFIIGFNDLSYFKRLGVNGNWANRIRLGLSSNFPSPFAPFAIDNNLNIRGVGNLVDRGTGTIVFNSEFRKTLFEKKWFVLQGNAFVDAGSNRLPGANFSNFTEKNNIRVYSGFGLRFIHKTIFNATFRLDYGFGLTEHRNGLVFGIGQYF